MASKRPLILMLTTHFPPKRGGVETSCIQYLEAAETDDRFTLAVLTYENRLDEEEEQAKSLEELFPAVA